MTINIITENAIRQSFPSGDRLTVSIPGCCKDPSNIHMDFSLVYLQL